MSLSKNPEPLDLPPSDISANSSPIGPTPLIQSSQLSPRESTEFDLWDVPTASLSAQVKSQYYPSKQSGRRIRRTMPLVEIPSNKQLELFSHLPQFEKITSIRLKLGFDRARIPPYIVSLGFKYSNNMITGSNARAVSLLVALKQFVENHAPNLDSECENDPTEFIMKITKSINDVVQFLDDCRPLSVSMGSGIRYLKQTLADSTLRTLKPVQIRDKLAKACTYFIHQRISTADQVISSIFTKRIEDGDVILTHGASSIVEHALKAAFFSGKKFRVVIVDSRPLREGKNLLFRLTQFGIECSYVLATGVSYIMKEITKVVLGAHSMLSNGNLVARTGTSVVACVAKTFSKPVIVLCETYKFSKACFLDSIDKNELADPEELVSELRTAPRSRDVSSELGSIHKSGDSSSASLPEESPINGKSKKNSKKKSQKKKKKSVLKDSTSNDSDAHTPLEAWRSTKNLRILNIRYDITPRDMIKMIICEIGSIPPTSVAVILGEIETEFGNLGNIA